MSNRTTDAALCFYLQESLNREVKEAIARIVDRAAVDYPRERPSDIARALCSAVGEGVRDQNGLYQSVCKRSIMLGARS